jgi:hypothetical protein
MLVPLIMCVNSIFNFFLLYTSQTTCTFIKNIVSVFIIHHLRRLRRRLLCSFSFILPVLDTFESGMVDEFFATTPLL